jgi:hypothetical protein
MRTDTQGQSVRVRPTDPPHLTHKSETHRSLTGRDLGRFAPSQGDKDRRTM